MTTLTEGGNFTVRYVDDLPVEMRWVPPMEGPRRPLHPGRCHLHDIVAFGCDLCYQWVYGWAPDHGF